MLLSEENLLTATAQVLVMDCHPPLSLIPSTLVDRRKMLLQCCHQTYTTGTAFTRYRQVQ
jgi:hypothetical protein